MKNATSCLANNRPSGLEGQDARLLSAHYSPLCFVAKIRGGSSNRKAIPSFRYLRGCKLSRRPPRPLALRIRNQTQHFPHGASFPSFRLFLLFLVSPSSF